MRILRVAQKVYPDVVGGGPYHVHALSRDQAAMGHDVTVLTVETDADRPHVEERAGYRVVRYPVDVEALGNAISSGVAQFLRRADEFDVVHAHSHLYFSTNLAALERHRSGVPLALTNHGLYSQNAPEWLFGAYLRTLGRWTFDTADVIFCYTPEERDAVRALGVSTPIEVISNGIDQQRFTPAGPGSDRIGDDSPSVLFVGRLVEGKRPGTVIEAFADVRDEFPTARLYLAGEGPLEGDLRELAVSKGIEDAVEFLGHVDYDEMPALCRSADVFVLPSRAEGLPRTVLESLSSGTPVVTSALPQLESISTEGGRVVEVGDVEGFATALCDLLGDDVLRDDLGERGRQLIQREYIWDDLVGRTTDRLVELCR
jgi:glycosyltransferase involved in cell wall biosynthesis